MDAQVGGAEVVAQGHGCPHRKVRRIIVDAVGVQAARGHGDGIVAAAFGRELVEQGHGLEDGGELVVAVVTAGGDAQCEVHLGRNTHPHTQVHGAQATGATGGEFGLAHTLNVSRNCTRGCRDPPGRPAGTVGAISGSV